MNIVLSIIILLLLFGIIAEDNKDKQFNLTLGFVASLVTYIALHIIK